MRMHLAAIVNRLGMRAIWATFLAVNSMNAVCMSTQSCQPCGGREVSAEGSCGVFCAQRKAASVPVRGHSLGDPRGQALSGEGGGGPSKLSGSQSDDDEDGQRLGADDGDGEEGAQACCFGRTLHATLHACKGL